MVRAGDRSIPFVVRTRLLTSSIVDVITTCPPVKLHVRIVVLGVVYLCFVPTMDGLIVPVLPSKCLVLRDRRVKLVVTVVPI